MADLLHVEPTLPTNNEGHAEPPRPALDPDPEVLQPPTWAPTNDEERRIFRVWKGFTLAERGKDALSWVWNYGVEIQSTTSRRWIFIRIQRDPKRRTPPLESPWLLGSIRTTIHTLTEEGRQEGACLYFGLHDPQTFRSKGSSAGQ
ncbi:hypothetical protein BKA56DRAFT_626038 [Ilyonectria sp. MPI-CAGE-AT-0026]|nr:hypothetical protein BKA56DRAFT_626038 [Ilyonectria sp. MPI-CAGE-AT-0026]